jgi:hypothetical protein
LFSFINGFGHFPLNGLDQSLAPPLAIKNGGGLRQHRMKEGEDSDQKYNRADPNDRANGASGEASPHGLDQIFNWIAKHGNAPAQNRETHRVS